MFVNIKGRLRKFAPYVDRPNSSNENIGEVLGIIILILFMGAFLYLVITGIPTIRIALNMFLETSARFLNIRN